MTAWSLLLAALLPAAAAAAAESAKGPSSKPAASALPEGYSCMFCHGEDGTLAGAESTQRLVITEADLARDIHWRKGLRCHDCHGGAPTLDDYTDHRKDPGFHSIAPADIPDFCGRCHSDANYMRRYVPSPRIDQETEYWTSGHGRRLRQVVEEHRQALEKLPPGAAPPEMENPGVATCVDCHTVNGKPHTIKAVDDQNSSVYATHVAETCSRCHSDAKLMAGRTYHGRPLDTNQYELWKKSVHGQALLKNGDLSAPTCNDCHGNHGALPPDVDSIANVCGACHVKMAKLFSDTRMKHQFEKLQLPGCATCHGDHQTRSPSDSMLGMEGNAVCERCHEDNKYGATLTGAHVAQTMRDSLENLKKQIAEAERAISEADRLGMEVRGPRFDLRQAKDSLTNARSLIHTFALAPVEGAVQEGLKVTAKVKQSAEDALAEHTRRRIWLAASLAPILVVVILLLLYIRAMPTPDAPSAPPAE